VSARRWSYAVIGGVLTTGTGVAVNLATEFKSDVGAWVAVGLLTCAGILAGVATERLNRPKPQPETAEDADGSTGVSAYRSTVVTVAGDKNRVRVRGGIGAGLLLSVSAITIVAVVAGMVAGRVTQTDGGAPAPVAVPTKSTPAQPFHVTLLDEPTDIASHNWFGGSAGYLFPSGTVRSLPAPLPSASDCSSWSTWALGQGGQRVSTTTVGFSVSALDDPVRVHEARLHVEPVNRQAIGDEITCAQGGPIPVSVLWVDLDKRQTSFEYPNEDSDPAMPRPLALQIEPGKAEQVDVRATSLDCYCSWYLELLIEVNGTEHRYRIDDDGKPYVTAPLRGTYVGYRFDGESLTWVPGLG
jgi:hypothetical protein